MDAREGSGPPLVVQTQGSGRSLPPGPSYLVGRHPERDIVIADARVSGRHAVLRLEDGHWVLADNGSTNGIYAAGQKVDRIEIDGECLVRLSDPASGPVLTCTVAGAASVTQPVPGAPARTLRIGRAPDNDIVISDRSVSGHHAELRTMAGACRIVDLGSTNGTFVNEQRVTDAPLSEGDVVGFGSATFQLAGRQLQELAEPAEPAAAPPPAAAAAPPPVTAAAPPQAAAAPPGTEDDGPLEIPYAVRWLVPRGERFANFDILNDNDTQLDYYRRFGHIYAAGIPTKKWRLVVVSDPELLDEVAADEEQFGKRVEDINFFAQLANSRGGGISVISDGEHYEQVRRVMLPWYAPSHQRTQLERMKDQARKLVAAWSAIPVGEPLDARAWMERYTLEVSGRGACAYDFGLLDGGKGDPHPFAAAVPASTKESILRVAEPRPDFTLFAGRARRERRKTYRRHNTELFRTAEALVRARSHTTPLGPQTDLLSRLLSTPDPETGEFLDAETVRDQVLMHLSNGFNGPSITGAWLAYILATRPDVEEKLIAEIDGITGGDPDYDLQYDDLAALTYTTQVIKEALRIYPPLPVTIRRSLKDGMLGRYRIRKGDIILVGTLAAQRDPRYWGPDPDRFDPEQFAIDKVAGRPRHAMIPFSIGKRQCMAQEVTFMMLRVILFEIGKHYRLRLAPFAYADVGRPMWERQHAEWNSRIWPALLELSGARPTQAAAARAAAENAASGALTGTDSSTAMERSLYGDEVASPRETSRPTGVTSIMRLLSSGPARDRSHTQPRVLLAPTILTNAVGLDTVEARALAWRELQAPGSPRHTRHQEVSLPPGVVYQAGDHLGICPKNDEEQVERLARHLGAAPDSLFRAPKTMYVHAVPKGVVLQVRNVLANLVDITGRPTVPLLDLLLEKATDPGERSRLAEIREVLQTPEGPDSPLRAAIDAGGYDVLRLLDEFGSCTLNIFEFLRVAQPLRPRYYSTSSSPRVHGAGVAHVTVGHQATLVPGLPGRDFRPMSSQYVHALREGDRLNVFIDSSAGFRLQEDVTKPMIFVSAGTGFAPMRAFCWERLAMKQAGAALAEAALFNGIRSSRLDYIYRDEIERFVTEGVLDHVHVATSREQPGRRDYVQDRIREQGALIWRLLAAGGYVYVCGAQPMRDAVRAAFADVIADRGSLRREHAEAYLRDLETTARYRPDLWG